MKEHPASTLFISNHKRLQTVTKLEPHAPLNPYPLEVQGMVEKDGSHTFSAEGRIALFLQPSLGGFNPWLLVSMNPAGENEAHFHNTVLEEVEPPNETIPYMCSWDMHNPIRILMYWGRSHLLTRIEFILKAAHLAHLTKEYQHFTIATAAPLLLQDRRTPSNVREIPRYNVVQCWMPL